MPILMPKGNNMKRDDRNNKGQFLKGTVPNPKGRPRKKLKPSLDTFIEGKEKELMERYVERAKVSDSILIDLINRILK